MSAFLNDPPKMVHRSTYEREFFKIYSNLEEFRKLKELYIDFNKRNEGNPIKANEEIDTIIGTYVR